MSSHQEVWCGATVDRPYLSEQARQPRRQRYGAMDQDYARALEVVAFTRADREPPEPPESYEAMRCPICGERKVQIRPDARTLGWKLHIYHRIK